MAELGVEERYAAAALFTLALHQSQVDAGAAGAEGAEAAAWGRPPETSAAEPAQAPAPLEQQKAAEWSAYWGYDCCGPGGIMEKLYRALGVPKRSWQGLMRLPEIAGPRRRDYMLLVSSYMQILDSKLAPLYVSSVAAPELASSTTQAEQTVPAVDGNPLPAANDSSGHLRHLSSDSAEGNAPRAVRDDLFHGLLASDSDSDVEADLASHTIQRQLLRRASSKARERTLFGDRLSPRPKAPSQEAPLSKQESSDLYARLFGTPASSTAPPYTEAAQQEDAVGDLSPRERLLFGDSVPPAVLPDRWERALSTDLHTQDRAASEVSPPGGVVQIDDRLHATGASWSLQHTRMQLAEELAALQTARADTIGHLSGDGPDEGEQATDKRQRQQRKATPQALGAIWELLEACLALQPPHETADEADSKDFLDGDVATVAGLAPQSRWYDARARTALKYVAAWLNVAWPKVVNLEGLLVYQCLLPKDESAARQKTPWERALQATTIGTAALGAGALFAVTGGLAAPALAAGIGGAITLLGGTAALASGASGFLATAAGTAVLASSLGAAGGGIAGSRMARRIGDVKEFGFWEVEAEPLAEDPRGQSGKLAETVGPSTEAQDAPLLGTSPERSDDRMDSAAGEWSRAGLLGTGQTRGLQAAAGDVGHITVMPATAQLTADNLQRMAGQEGGRPSVNGGRGMSPPLSDKSYMHSAENVLPAPASAASLADTQAGTQSTRMEGRWGWWHQNWKEPPLLLAPISPHRHLEDMRLSVTIGVNGWISEKKDYLRLWEGLVAAGRAGGSEVFTLVWESKELLALDNAIASFIGSQAGQEAGKWVLTHFLYTGLVAAAALPAAVYTATQFIDTAWSVAMLRAQKAGRLLAHVILAGAVGGRPLVLVGYSMGARLVFHTLLELARHQAKGYVETVVLLGTPVSLRPERWAMARSVVSGRFINGFSRRDWVLGLVYRGTNGFIKEAAGLAPVDMPGIENVNLSTVIAGHMSYRDVMSEILLDIIHLYD